MKHHQVFILDETCFSPEVKHFHFNEIFIDYTTHGNNTIPVVNKNSKTCHYIISFEETCQKLGLRAASRVPNTSKQMKARGRRPRAFICFSVFGTRDEAVALVFDILLEKQFLAPAFRRTDKHQSTVLYMKQLLYHFTYTSYMALRTRCPHQAVTPRK